MVYGHVRRESEGVSGGGEGVTGPVPGEHRVRMKEKRPRKREQWGEREGGGRRRLNQREREKKKKGGEDTWVGFGFYQHLSMKRQRDGNEWVGEQGAFTPGHL